jgi:hypothetical protein
MRLGCLAQLVEQLTLNQRVDGSIPSVPTTSPLQVIEFRKKRGKA